MDQAAPTTSPRTPARPLPLSLLKLARPHQWVKSAFVLVGPLYGLSDHPRPLMEVLVPALLAALAFALASSACYVVNDIFDAEADRLHPRKARRPIASGAVSPGLAWAFAVALVCLSGLVVFLLDPAVRLLVGVSIGLYIANVSLYSAWVKHVVIADVMGLSLGFVLRVLGGCAAVAIAPSTWLLNCTFFLAMFLAFGKRLGERRTAGADPSAVRAVQAAYTDEMLRMAVVVTAVVTLLSYAGYVQAREEFYTAPGLGDLNLLWLTVLPATFGMLRCIVLLERGDYDDPTELALRDRAFGAAGLLFAALTLVLIARFRLETPA